MRTIGKFQNKIENVCLKLFYPLWIAVHRPDYAKGNKLDLSKFELVLEDDFSKPEIDKSIWQIHHDNIRKGGYWSEEQAFIENGQLHIRTEYKKDGKFGEGYYSCALATRDLFEQTYGYFECRCKLPAAVGMWSAFWLQSKLLNKGVSGTEGTEIDVFESPLYVYKNNNMITSNLHYNGYDIKHRFHTVGFFKVDDPYNTFNTYGVEWNEKEYIFYINGVETGRSSFGGVSKKDEYLLLSTEIDGVGGKPNYGWSGNIKDNAPENLPADFIVDYVRVYQYKK